MSTFKLNISSPDGSIWKGDTVAIYLRGTEGDLAVMADHIPFITAVKPCEFHLELPDGSIKYGVTESGILTVTEHEVVFLSSSAKWKN